MYYYFREKTHDKTILSFGPILEPFFPKIWSMVDMLYRNRYIFVIFVFWNILYSLKIPVSLKSFNIFQKQETVVCILLQYPHNSITSYPNSLGWLPCLLVFTSPLVFQHTTTISHIRLAISHHNNITDKASNITPQQYHK